MGIEFGKTTNKEVREMTVNENGKYESYLVSVVIITTIAMLIVAVFVLLPSEDDAAKVGMEIPSSDWVILETESGEYAFEVYAPNCDNVMVYYGDNVGPMRRIEKVENEFARFTLPSDTWWTKITT